MRRFFSFSILVAGPTSSIEMYSRINLPFVSILIPCYNASRWVREAIDSCLNQTYENIEIIVVDDGSTDDSLAVLKTFLPRINLIAGPNRGGNAARNSAFALSKGEYIQYLDADDCLELDKIARQVGFLEETKSDVVYGDWRYIKHMPDGLVYLDKIQISGGQDDILASLLSSWWIPPCAILYRREVVANVGGWDETMLAAQDRDFFTSVALSGAKIQYQAGCSSLYRFYGLTTVSTSNGPRWREQHFLSMRKSEIALAGSGRLTAKYRTALAAGYFDISRRRYPIDLETVNRIVDKIGDLCPSFFAKNESFSFVAIQWLFGFRFAMRTFSLVRSTKQRIKSKLRETLLFGAVLRLRRAKRRFCG